MAEVVRWDPWKPTALDRANAQSRAKMALTKMFPDEYRTLYLEAMCNIRDAQIGADS